jgi:serine/threonine protein kinase
MSRSTGDTYYLNTVTGETQFERPTLPDGWEQMKSRSTGDTYYLNTVTSETQFEPPTLPAGWEKMKSRSTGDTYYLNTVTGETQFERPTLPAHTAEDPPPVSIPSDDDGRVAGQPTKKVGRHEWEYPKTSGRLQTLYNSYIPLATALGSLRAELGTLSLRKIRARVVDADIAPELLEAALAAEQPKEATIDLLLRDYPRKLEASGSGGHAIVYKVPIEIPDPSDPQTRIFIFKFNNDEEPSEKENFESVWSLVNGEECGSFFIEPPMSDPAQPELLIFEQEGFNLTPKDMDEPAKMKEWLYGNIVNGDRVVLGDTGTSRKFVKDLFLGMQCMGDREIYHGDIKPGNFMLFDVEGGGKVPKFIDLGDIKLGRNINKLLGTQLDDPGSLFVFDDMTIEYVSHFYQRLIELQESELSLPASLPQVGQIKNILLTNDRYAFLLMLIEQLYGFTNWFRSWYNNITGMRTDFVPSSFLNASFWNDFTGKIKTGKEIVEILINANKEMNQNRADADELKAELVPWRVRILELHDDEKDEEEKKWMVERIKLKKLNQWFETKSNSLKSYGIYNIFQKIFQGLNEIKGIQTIEDLSEACDDWNLRIWDPLWQSVMDEEEYEEETEDWVQPGPGLHEFEYEYEEETDDWVPPGPGLFDG